MSAVVNVGAGEVGLDEVVSVLKLIADGKARDRLPPGMLREASRVVREAERIEGGLFHTTFPSTGPYRRELYPKIMSFYSAGKRATQRCIMAANRVGKSRACAYEVTAHLTGMYPDWWPGRRFRQPVDTWAGGEDVEHRARHHPDGVVRRGTGGARGGGAGTRFRGRA